MTYRRLPPLTAIRSFEAAARHASVSRAAAELGVTPGAVSRQIRTLEDTLSLSLFQRTPTGMSLTPAGEALRDAAQEALDRIAKGVMEAGRVAAGRRPLSVGAYALFASRWLIPRWGRLREKHPGLDFDLTTEADPLRLLPGRFDAVVAVADGTPRPGLVIRPLVPIETVPVCAPGLANAGGFDWTGKRLLHSRQRPHDWARWLAAAGVTGPDPTAGPSFESIGLAIDAAAEGLGVALAIKALLAPDLLAGRVVVPVPFARRSSRSFVLMYEAARATDPSIRAFETWLVEEAAVTADESLTASRRSDPARIPAASPRSSR